MKKWILNSSLTCIEGKLTLIIFWSKISIKSRKDPHEYQNPEKCTTVIFLNSVAATKKYFNRETALEQSNLRAVQALLKLLYGC